MIPMQQRQPGFVSCCFFVLLLVCWCWCWCGDTCGEFQCCQDDQVFREKFVSFWFLCFLVFPEKGLLGVVVRPGLISWCFLTIKPMSVCLLDFCYSLKHGLYQDDDRGHWTRDFDLQLRHLCKDMQVILCFTKLLKIPQTFLVLTNEFVIYYIA